MISPEMGKRRAPLKTRISIRACQHVIAISQRWGDPGIPLDLEAVEGGTGHPGELGDSGLGNAQIAEAPDVVLLAVET